MSRAPLLLLLVSLASLVPAQQQSQSSSSIRTPYSCFYDECPAASSTLAGKAQFESCLKAGMQRHLLTHLFTACVPVYAVGSPCRLHTLTQHQVDCAACLPV